MADPFPPENQAVTAAAAPELLVVGRLVAAQGLAGELRVLPLSDFPERFTRPGRRWLQAKGQPAVPVTLRRGRQLPGRELFVVRIDGVDQRSAAEALVGHELLVPASDRPALEPGEFHLLDLVGLEVRLLQKGLASEGPAADPGPGIGTVRDLIHAGNDLLEVELHTAAPAGGASHPADRGDLGPETAKPTGKRRVFIPFVEAIVPVVNLEQGWIGLTPPPGLLDL